MNNALSDGTIHPLIRALWLPRFSEAAEWIEQSIAANRPEGRLPLVAEEFGKGSLAGVSISGIADRFDRMPDGRLAVVDYKTGGGPKNKQIKAGLPEKPYHAFFETAEWTVDGVERKTYSGPGVPNVDMYVILNLAIGGNWPGAPDASTAFPATYEVDYVRTYQPLAGDAGVGGAGGSGTGGAAGAGGAATGGASAGGTSGSGGQSGGGGMPQAGTGGASGGGSTDDSGGCGCRAGASERSAASASLLLLTSLATSRLVRRRRRPENSRSLGRGRRPR